MPGKQWKLTMVFFAALIFFAASQTIEATWKTLGVVTGVQKNESSVVLTTAGKGKIFAGCFDTDVVRIRIAPSGVFERDFSYAFDSSATHRAPKADIITSGAKIVLDCGVMKVVIARTSSSIDVFDKEGKSVLLDDKAQPVEFNSDTKAFRTTKLRSSEVETYYGFGEKAFPEMSRNGKFISNWNTDTFSYPVGTDPLYQSIPFFYALYDGNSYGLFFNNTYRTFFDMGASSPGKYTFGADGGELDYFVFSGGKDRSPKKVLEDYSALTGRTPLPPVWSLGFGQSRWSYFPEQRVREIAGGFRSRKIPLDALYLDVDYMDEYRVFTWNKKRFPEPAKMIGDLNKDGIKIVLIIDPGIKADENYETYKDGNRADIFVKNPDGSTLIRNVWAKESAFPDFTDPKARAWFGEQYKKNIQEGVAGFWNDMNEPGVFLTGETDKPEILHHPDKTFPYDTPHFGEGARGDHRRYHNVYGMQMARATFEGVKKLSPEKRPFVLTRAGFSGEQRYSAAWTGDNYASWDHLALTIPMLTNMSVSGVPFVGADVGGFNDTPTGELYTRWLQAAALTPFFRAHSVGWVKNKEPWEFGDDYTKINRATIELRYKFLPYLYTLFHEHELTGQPVMRPLWYEFPKDKLTYLVNDEFMVGDDVLVAPVVKEGMTNRGVYLPAGAEWIDWWTGAKLESGKLHYLDVPLDRLPIFIRAGAVIPTEEAVQYTGQMPDSPVTLNVAAGITVDKIVTFTIFQDAGEGYGYRQRAWREIRIEHKRGSLTIGKTGDFAGQKIKFINVIGIQDKPKEMIVDGKSTGFDFDQHTKSLKVEIDENAREVRMVR